MNYEKAYIEALEKARQFSEHPLEEDSSSIVEYIFPELKESEDEIIRKELIKETKGSEVRLFETVTNEEFIAWLEKQGSEPNWCYHKVNLSNCSEEYRKAYYDGWNNCNMQHSQCKSEGNDVVKCLINGMKFYYEGDEEATWGTEKFSMKVKDILSWLEKQGHEWNAGKKELKKIQKPLYGRGDIIDYNRFDYEQADIQQKDFAPKATTTDRQLYNRAILKILSNYVEKYPDIRFGQMLCNLDINPHFDQESREAYWNLNETINKQNHE